MLEEDWAADVSCANVDTVVVAPPVPPLVLRQEYQLYHPL